LHPSSAAQLQPTAIGFVWFGVYAAVALMMMGANGTRNM
jgi:hypothetical protein